MLDKEKLEELRELCIEYHQCGADLYNLIKRFESAIETDGDSADYMRMFTLCQHQYRANMKHANGWRDLESREEAIWQKILHDETKDLS